MDKIQAISFALVAITPIACLAACASRPAVNELDLQLLTFLRERDRLWDLPASQGGIREWDVSEQVCPMISLERLRQIVEIDRTAIEYVPLTAASEEWGHQFALSESTGFMRTPTLVIWLSDDGVSCDVGFRQYGGI